MSSEKVKSIASAVALGVAVAGLMLVSETLHLVRQNDRFVSEIGGHLWIVAAKYLALALVSGAAVGALVRDSLHQGFAVAGVWYLIISLKILWLGSKLLTKPVVLVGFLGFTAVFHGVAWVLAKRLRLSASSAVMLTVAYANIGIAAVIAWAHFGGDLRSFLGAGGVVIAFAAAVVVVVVTVILDRLLEPRLHEKTPLAILGGAAFVGVIAVVILTMRGGAAGRATTVASQNADDVYVVSIDAMRFDAVADYVAKHPTSHLANLVRTSTSFENVVTRGPSTQSTLTEHTFGGPHASCAASIPTSLRGYQTHMLFAHAGQRVAGAECYATYFSGEGAPLASHYSLVALAQKLTSSTLEREKYLHASVLLGRLRASATSPQPLYAFMHFLELHSPYAPISKQGDVTYAAKIREYTSTCLVAGCDMSQTNNQELAATARAGYQALMSEVDDVIGEVLSIARQRQRPFRLVVTADHGELFGEYGAFAHRFGFVPELRHVPFILHDSTKPTASRRCELMLSTDALRTAVLGGEYRGHDKLEVDVPGVGRGLIDRQAATLTFELSEGAVANSGVSRNMHREAKGALPYPIVTCE